MNTSNLPTPLSERDRAIVLVHGAWVGEWSWLPVLPLLRESGRPIFNVSLTGHGTRRHLAGPHINLTHHVEDVVGVFDTFDLSNVTLVGHSYGGRVITQTSQRVGDRIASMVYLDAHTPVIEAPPQPAERTAMVDANGGMLPFTGYDPTPELVGGAEGVKWFLERTVSHSAACVNEPWLAELPKHIQRTFIYATNDSQSRFAQYAEIIRQDATWSYHELDGPHWLMFSHPAEVAALILKS